MATPLSYKDAGVDIDAGNRLVDLIKPLVRGTARSGADGAIGGFGGVFDLAATGFRDPLLVAANDGVGTKLRLAIDMGVHHTVGIDCVAMCVNDLVVQGAEPLFFLDYFACGSLRPEQAAEVVGGVAAGCREAGCALLGGETAEMPGLYADDDYDLAGFAVGAVERDALLPRGVEPGDRLIAFGSTGVHSNGFSLVRRILEASGTDPKSAAPFEPTTSLAIALLEPTRIYVKVCLAVARHVRGFAHVTGGGLPENLPRILPSGCGAVVKLDRERLPPIFEWLQRTGNVAPKEMLRTFNCGVGMVAVAPARAVEAIMAEVGSRGVEAWDLGAVTSEPGVRFEGELFS